MTIIRLGSSTASCHGGASMLTTWHQIFCGDTRYSVMTPCILYVVIPDIQQTRQNFSNMWNPLCPLFDNPGCDMQPVPGSVTSRHALITRFSAVWHPCNWSKHDVTCSFCNREYSLPWTKKLKMHIQMILFPGVFSLFKRFQRRVHTSASTLPGLFTA